MDNKGIGGQLIELASVDSTNNYAADRLAQGELRHGAVVVAREQTAGRGQRGRNWYTGKGLDLACSVVLLPSALRAEDQFDLARTAAIAVHDVVSETLMLSAGLGGSDVRIKWPNDILIDRLKVCGILIRNEVRGALVQSSIVGIGINANSTELNAGFNATSLRMESGQPIGLAALRESLCARLEHWWNLCERKDASLAERYNALLWSRGRITDFELDGEAITARPIEVDARGLLVIEREDGSTGAYSLDRLRFAGR